MHVARQADTDLSQRSFSSTFLNKTQHRLEHSRLCSGKPHTLPDRLTFSNIDEHSCQGEFAAHWQRLSIEKPESLSRWHTSHFFSSLSSSRGGWKKKKTDHRAAADLCFSFGAGDSYWLVGWMSLSLCFKWLEWVSALGIYHSSTVT